MGLDTVRRRHGQVLDLFIPLGEVGVVLWVNRTAQPQASAAATTSRSPAAWNGTPLRVSRSATRFRSVTRVVRPTSDGSAGAVPPGTMLPTRSAVTTVTRDPVPKSTSK